MLKKILTLSMLSCAIISHAWDASGHEVVAQIAISTCKPATLTKLKNLLSTAVWTVTQNSGAVVTHDFRNPLIAARFADDILNSQFGKNPYETKNYRTWHYIDLQYMDRSSIFANWPPTETDDTIVQGIDDAIAVIKNKPARGFTKGKVEAMLFLLHFVGDIHQPLHCSDDYDKGGHRAMTTDSGGTIIPHKVWDGEATARYSLHAAGNSESAEQINDDLATIRSAATDLINTRASHFSQYQRTNFNRMAWVKESYKYACNNIFAAQQPLTQTTLDAWQEFGLERVTIAGLRLGRLLDALAPYM